MWLSGAHAFELRDECSDKAWQRVSCRCSAQLWETGAYEYMGNVEGWEIGTALYNETPVGMWAGILTVTFAAILAIHTRTGINTGADAIVRRQVAASAGVSEPLGRAF